MLLCKLAKPELKKHSGISGKRDKIWPKNGKVTGILLFPSKKISYKLKSV